MRKELLRQAVQENEYTRRGMRLPRPSRNGSRPGLMLATVMAAGGLLAIVGLWAPGARSLGETGSRELQAASRSATGVPLVLPTSVGRTRPMIPNPEEVRFSEPGPMDSAVLPLSVHRIVLDPGHGGRDVGTVTPGGLFEKDLAMDIARRLRELLEARGGVDVHMTREDDAMVRLRDRAQLANELEADLFVSIHLNWLEAQTHGGIETFYLGPTEDPRLVRLTSLENRDSGYSLADTRRLLEGIYLDLRQEQSRRLAESVQESVYTRLAGASPGLIDRGTKPAPFLVLVATEMPAILAEVSSLSSAREAELLATSDYRQNIAEALFDGIDAYIINLSQGDSGERSNDRQEG